MSISNIRKLQYVKYAVIIAAATAAGIALGRFITDYKTQYLLSRKHCGTYRGIEVYKCGEINAENFIGHAYILDSAPDALVECCTDMYFTGGELTVPIVGVQGGTALGLTQDTTIYISTDTFNADVIYHELFHAYDNVNKITASAEYMDIYSREKDNVYVEVVDDRVHPQEYFAAAGAVYLLEPAALELKAPETYEYINQLIEEYK